MKGGEVKEVEKLNRNRLKHRLSYHRTPLELALNRQGTHRIRALKQLIALRQINAQKLDSALQKREDARHNLYHNRFT